jgi:hypothetical protein
VGVRIGTAGGCAGGEEGGSGGRLYRGVAVDESEQNGQHITLLNRRAPLRCVPQVEQQRAAALRMDQRVRIAQRAAPAAL